MIFQSAETMTSYVYYMLISTLFLSIARTDSIQGDAGNVLIPCSDDEPCRKGMPGSGCVEGVCVCQLEGNKCRMPGAKETKEVKEADGKIEEGCRNGERCSIEKSEKTSKEEKLVCNAGEVAYKKHNICLPVVPKLNSMCVNSIQCQIEHSECRLAYCKCPESMKTHRGSCFFIKELGDDCRRKRDCMDIENAKCYTSQCVCKKGYVSVATRLCLRAANNTGDSCIADSQCNDKLGHAAVCHENRCACKDPYRFSEKLKVCVRYEAMFRECTKDKDCHLSLDEADYLVCVNKSCRCKDPYKEYEYDCVKVSESSASSPLLLCAILSILPYLHLF